MTQGDEKWHNMTDEEFYAHLAAQHGPRIATVAKTVQRQRRKQVPRRVGVKLKIRRKVLPTRRVDEYDALRHGEPPARLLSNRHVKTRRRSS